MEQGIDFNEVATLLADTAAWRVVCNALPIEEERGDSAGYRRWLKNHLDSHLQREILFALSGESYEHFNGTNYYCRPGSLFLFDSNDVHAKGYPPAKERFVHLWLMVLDRSLVANICFKRYGSTFEMRRIPLLIAKNERDALDRIWRLVTVPPLWISTNLRRSLLVSVLLPIITRALDEWQGPVTVDSTLQHHQVIIDAIKRHIETNLPQGTDLDTLAHISGYSKYHFSRLFKRISGEKITAFIDRCRLNRVAEMRQAGAMQKEIAAALGFASPTAFANWQRKMETPGG